MIPLVGAPVTFTSGPDASRSGHVVSALSAQELLQRPGIDSSALIKRWAATFGHTWRSVVFEATVRLEDGSFAHGDNTCLQINDPAQVRGDSYKISSALQPIARVP